MSVDFTIRPATVEDLPFLWDMLFEAAAVSEEIRKKGKERALSLPFIFHILENFGRQEDVAIVAQTKDEQLIGAAWFRLFPESDKGFGFVSSEIPEIAIAVVPGRRGQGAGTKLMEKLIETARAMNFPALSLSVDRRNPALRLYERLGFRDALVSKEIDSSVTMILQF